MVQRDGKRRFDEDSFDKDKEWLLDVDGWSLPAYCYVDWKKPDSGKPIPGLTRDCKFCQVSLFVDRLYSFGDVGSLFAIREQKTD